MPSVITAPEEAPAGATRREPPGLNLVLRRSPSLRRAPIEATAQGQEDAPQGARGGECAIRSGSRQAASMVGPSGWVYDLIVREVSAPSSFIKLPCSSVGATRKEQPRGTKRPRQDDEEHFDLGERIGRRTLAEPCRRRRRSSVAEPAVASSSHCIEQGAVPGDCLADHRHGSEPVRQGRHCFAGGSAQPVEHYLGCST